MKLSYRSLRILAKMTRIERVLGFTARTVSFEAGWTRVFDVEIANRRFTLWMRASSQKSAPDLYVITIDGRVRFATRANVSVTAFAAWEAVTGIRHLRRYEDGCPVYGHRLPVKIFPVPEAEIGTFTLNYTRPLVQTNDMPRVPYAKEYLASQVAAGATA